MKNKFKGEERQRFSFRKLSVGLVSATIGSSFFMFVLGGQAQADELTSAAGQSIRYQYVSENELTEAEKNLIVKEVPQLVEAADDSYYLVYRPKAQAGLTGTLPSTGHSYLRDSILALTGLSLVVFVVSKGRKGKKSLQAMLLVTSLGATLLSPAVLAITAKELAHYNQSLHLQIGDKLPEPLAINGYDYVGYIKNDAKAEPNKPISTYQADAMIDKTVQAAGKDKQNEQEDKQRAQATDETVKAEAEKDAAEEEQAAVERQFARLPMEQDSPDLVMSNSSRIEAVPFETIYQESSDLPQGTSEIVQAGVEGVRTIVTRAYTSNGEQIDSEEISNQVTVTPVAQIVKVGTAAPQSVPNTAPTVETPDYPLTSRDETTTESIPFQVIEEPTDELVQGATEIVRQGQNGVRTTTTRIYSSNGEEVDRQLLSSEETQAPVAQIIKVGTAAPQSVPNVAPKEEVPDYPLTSRDETTTETIPFQVIEEPTDELVQGATEIVRQGQNGVRTITSRVYTSHGEEVDRQILSSEETTASVNQIVKVGTAALQSVPNVAPKEEVPDYPLISRDETTTESIPFQVIEEPTDELVQGATEIVRLGQNGVRTITSRIYSSNAEEVDRQELSREETTAPVNQIVKVGTADPQSVPNVAPTEEIPDYPLSSQDETTTETIPFQVIEEPTDELVQGATEIVRTGQDGVRTTTTRVYTSNGEEIDRQVLSSEETQAPVAQIVKVGTAAPQSVPNTAPTVETPDYPLTSRDETTTETIPFQVIEEPTDELVQGATEIVRLGQNGVRTITSRVYTSNGEEVDRQLLSSEETQAPVNQIVKVGTAKTSQIPDNAPLNEVPNLPIASQDVTQKEVIPYMIEQAESVDLAQGQSQVMQYGVDGERRIVMRNYTVEGEIVHSEEISNEVTKNPITEVVSVGKGTPNQIPDNAPVNEVPELQTNVQDSSRLEAVAFETVYQESSDLPQGTSEIVQAGVEGVRTIVTRAYSANGEQIDSEEISNQVTVTPVNQIIKVGTAAPHSLPTTAPKEEVPEYPLTSQDETTTETIPFQVIEEPTDELVQGATEIVRQGQNGVRTIKTRIYSSNGEEIDRQLLSSDETTAPVAQIIKVGTVAPYQLPQNPPSVEELSSLDLLSLYERLTEADALKQTARYFNDKASNQASYDQAILAGQAVLENSSSNQAEINHLLSQIESSKERLNGSPVVKEDLQTEHDLKDSLRASAKYFNATADKKTTYDNQIIVARQVLDNPVANQEQVNQALANLSQAKLALDGLAKIKPTLTIQKLSKDEDSKSVTVEYALVDTTNSYQSATAQLYQGQTLLKEVEINDPNGSLTFDNLDYYTDYRLKTKLTYRLDEGSFTEIEPSSQDFTLTYKKIEFRDIDKIELYGKENKRYRRYVSLTEIPEDLSNYFVKIQSTKYKEMNLPIASIVESEENGQPVYKVTVAIDQLVEDKDGAYQPNYSFTIGRAQSKESNVYTTFSSLIEAMKTNLSGDFILGADLTAEELNQVNSEAAYVTGDFTGSLTGSYQGKQYSLYNLTKPLFASLQNATISNLGLKEVAIESQLDVAALANKAENTTISNIAVEGSLALKEQASSLAGLVLQATDTQISSSSFKGNLRANSNADGAVVYNVGGLVANLKGGKSLLDKSKAQVTISSEAKNNNHRIGGLVGRLEGGARLSNSYATGRIENSSNSGQVGGIVGSSYWNGQISNVLSDLDLVNGYSITGDRGYSNAPISNAFALEGKQAKEADSFATARIKSIELASKLAEMGLTEFSQPQKVRLDYSQVKHAQADRLIAYENMEKLLPFYNKETIIAYGNQVDASSKLYKVALVDLVPMKDNEIITNVQGREGEVNRLLLHYADNTVEYMDMTYAGKFQNQAIAEYRLGTSQLLYTPEYFLSDYSQILAKVLPDLQAVNYDSAQIRQTLGLASDASLDELYLDKSYEAVKNTLATELSKLLAMDKSINSMGDAVADYTAQKILDNKEALMLGLSYLNRWYNINFDDVNTKELSSYKFDFFGNNETSTLDTIIALGHSGMDNLKSKNNHLAFERSLAQVHGKTDLFDYLTSLRQLFLPNKSNNEWLKTNSKAYIVEMKSNVAEARKLQDEATGNSKYSVGVYDKITQASWEHRSMLLPLLTMEEKGVYIISNLSTLSFGAYDRYRDKDENGQVLTGQAFYDDVERRIDQAAEWQRDHYDFWYKTLLPEYRDKLFRSVPVYDGFSFKDEKGEGYWATAHDKRSAAMRDFFGPVGKWYANNGHAAYATGSLVHLVSAGTRLLDEYGMSVYTHEMTHNSDGTVYFEGHGRREGQGPELYARGLLQSTPLMNDATITLNTLFKVDKDSKDRMHVADPAERFKNADDLQEYVHGMFDMIYTLDYLEGMSILKQSDEVKGKWFRKIENYYVTDEKDGRNTHAGNQVRRFTAEELKNLTTFDSLIDQDVINRREYKDEEQYGRNSYFSLSSLSPIYSALSNPNGAPGDIMFRRMAYELLAAKGYHDGFVPYVSNKYGPEAMAEGVQTWSSWWYGHYVPLVDDDRVFKNIFKGEYATWSDFKKAMYKERIDQLPNLKPITIEYELNVPNSTKQVTINSYQELQELMDQAVARDVQTIDRATSVVQSSWVNLLKKKVYNAYLRSTDDFRTSIFAQK